MIIKQQTYSQQQQGGGGGKGSSPPPAPVAATPPEPKAFEAAGEKPTGSDNAAQMVDAGRKGTKGLRIDLGSNGTAGGSGLSIPA